MSRYYAVLTAGYHRTFDFNAGVNRNPPPFTDEKTIPSWIGANNEIVIVTIPSDVKIHKRGNNYTSNYCTAVIVPTEQWVMWDVKSFCLNAVRQDGLLLRFVRNQTEEVIRAALLQNGMALKYVKDPTQEMCLLAMQQNARAFQLVPIDKRDNAINTIAVETSWTYLALVEQKTELLCVLAVLQSAQAINLMRDCMTDKVLNALQSRIKHENGEQVDLSLYLYI
jgi:hypothetical protein